MARVRAILIAVVTAVRRDLKSLGSFSGNNLFVVGVIFLFLKDPEVFVALGAVIALVLFIPLSADPLRVLPHERFNTWPLSTWERRTVRIASVWLNPIAWFVLAIALWKRVSMGVCAVAAGMFAIGFVLPSLPANRAGMWRHLPLFPGRLSHLMRKNLREMLSTLDFWCTAVASGISLGYRIAGVLPADALLPLTILVMMSLSTYAQTLFGLDGPGGITRYRLLPVPGWQIIGAKDLPFLLASAVMTLPLAPGAGLAAVLTALAAGHDASVTRYSNQVRWRFSSGASFGMSLFQVVTMCAAAAAVYQFPLLLLVCLAAYGWSAWSCGRTLFQDS